MQSCIWETYWVTEFGNKQVKRLSGVLHFVVFHSRLPVGGQLRRWSLLVSLFPLLSYIIGMRNHSCAGGVGTPVLPSSAAVTCEVWCLLSAAFWFAPRLPSCQLLYELCRAVGLKLLKFRDTSLICAASDAGLGDLPELRLQANLSDPLKIVWKRKLGIYC